MPDCTNTSMKNLLIALLVVVSISLGALTARMSNQLAKTQTELADVQNQLKKASEMQEQVVRAERKSKVLDDSLVATSKLADEKAKQAEQLQKSLADAKSGSVNPFGAMSKMFKDPAMKEMIKMQQKASIGPIIDKQYAELFQQLNLTPEQTAALKSLLVEKMLAGSDASFSMMDGSLPASQRAELAKQIKTARDAADAQIKQFLGDENNQTFQAYEKTTPYRMVVSQFSDQLANGSTPLSQDQQAQLIQTISEVSNGYKRTTDPGNLNPSKDDFASMLTEEKINRMSRDNVNIDQQVLTRVQQILTPEQLTAFQQFQESRRTLQINSMKIAAKMFAPKTQ